MISVKDLIDSIDFEPTVIYLHDGEKDIKIDYATLKENFIFNLDSLLELVPMTGHVFFSEHTWRNETDLHCDTSVLELLKQSDEEQNGARDQKLSNYLLMIQHALTDLHFGDVEGIMELAQMLEANED